VEEGIVAGGGVALLRCLPVLEALDVAGDRKFGVDIVRRAVQEPTRAIAENGGLDGPVIVHRILEGEGGFGFNAQTEEYGDMFEMGIIDPVKVVRCALQNAASVAGMMLTTEALVCEKPKKKTAGPRGGGGGGMGGMGGMGGDMGDMDF